MQGHIGLTTTFWMQVAGQVNAVLEGVGPFVDPGVSLLCFLSCKLSKDSHDQKVCSAQHQANDFIGLKGATMYQTDLEDVLELLNIVHAFLCWPSGAMPCHPVSELRLTGLMPG